MKNYIITSNEYDIINKRLERLYERRTRLKTNITKTTSTLKEVVTFGGDNQDKMTDYVIRLQEVEEEIKVLEEEARQLKEDLKYMDSRLSNIQDIKEQVFVMFYIRGMKPKHIAPRIPCDLSTVYAKLREIKKECRCSEKIPK